MRKWTLVKVRQDVDYFGESISTKYKPFAFRFARNPDYTRFKSLTKLYKQGQK
jgi:hypothetical protein